jgi:FSR family fosmidomycin resistance protein-like MFS transporter
MADAASGMVVTSPERALEVRASDVAWASLVALASGHFAVDCCTGIWPVYKTLAHLDIAKAGLIATSGSIAGNALQVAFGILADRGWRKHLMIGGVLLAGAITVVPWMHSYTLMFAVVLATYVGSAAFHPSGTGAAASLSRSRTGVLVGLFLAGGYGGYALSQIVFSTVYEGARPFTPVLLLIPLTAAITIGATVPSATLERRAGAGARVLLRRQWSPLAALFAVQVFATAANVALIFLLPDLLESRHAPGWMVRGGGHFALVIGGCLSLIPAGHAADRWGARRVLLVANVATGVLLTALLLRPHASPADLAIVAAFGAFNGMNNVVTVAEGNRILPGQASGVSALMMGLPWCFAATAAVIGGVLADPARGGTPAGALWWLGIAIPLALVASLRLRATRTERAAL